jgi:hypothetical protein
MAKRRADRLRALQNEVLAAKEINGRKDGSSAKGTADTESLELSPPETLYEEEGSTHP